MTLFDADFSWHNAPPSVLFEDNDVTVVTGLETDFWRQTFYGFWRDNGHFLSKSVAGDFSVEVTVQGEYEALYDQAGLMIRLSESHWIKAGIEFTDGQTHLSVVITNDQSDWSLLAVPFDRDGIRIRLTRHAEAIRIQYLNVLDNGWKPVRLGYFPATGTVDVGIMCCSPKREGFKARFKDFHLGAPIGKDLHD